MFLIFQKMELPSPKLKSILIFQKDFPNPEKNKIKKDYTFSYKQTKFYKSKYFLINKCFFFIL